MGLLFMGFGLVSLGYFLYAQMGAKDYENGIRAAAEVVSKDSGTRKDAAGQSKVHQHILEVKFTTPEGAERQTKVSVTKEEYAEHEPGSTIEVFYPKDRPEVLRTAETLSAAPELLYTGLGMLTVGLGICVAWRVIKPGG